ncbi:hypothetical protein HYPSUDRAFT_34708 [Hypholoma sublateritium FD-334 SS-4]|uniref:Xylanolytic transcriptional activator regulatory domain-containing protein n=1 Tax=Hypholoma sublateritium (strain FD-334 SS-4) TaxID=945553 RepID=A0A0D2PGA6_HYPSF|nr:hypothetical protein HYPSUDRAFT_34708 [Hypholoma sublateritium FD-334 SS-4]
MPDNRCTNCVQYGLECTHKEVTKTLGSAKGYVESLESRLEKMDRLLSKLLPGVDVNQQVDRMESPAVLPCDPEVLPRNDDESSATMVTVQLNRLTLNPQQNRFFGKSSGYQLVQTALDLKQEYTGEIIPRNKTLLPMKRYEFWDIPSWVTTNPDREPDHPDYVFPDDDLIASLIDFYFTQVNCFLPLLHRQTLEKSVAEGLHREDPMFGGVLLLVCAHGARFSDDPRVLAEGTDSPRSSGWRWFEQVHVLRKNLYRRTTLYELQLQALHVLFCQSSETPHGIWAQIGLAVRLSQEVGAHRRRPKTADDVPTVENELWKRAFWVLLSLDRHISSYAGRPCALQDEDFDLDLPLECDDEYWEHGFQQPPDKPSSISFFNCYLRLIDILAYAMRLIYPIKRPRNNFGRPPLSEQQVIAELDSAMNGWMDSVPTHLRWNPNCDNPLFLKQSAALHATYYHLQIFIHRPFIPSPRNPVPVSFPSLAICTNAARSCCHVLESYTKLGPLPFSFLQNTAFTAAVILLLNIWSGRRSGYAPNPKREMEDVQRCREVLKVAEKRWASAGRFWDILTELSFVGDMSIHNSTSTAAPTAAPAPAANNVRPKRPREADDDKSHSASPPPVSSTSPEAQPRNIVGSRRVSSSLSAPASPLVPTPPCPPALFQLPMYSNELGRLPIYGQFNFSDVVGDPHARGPGMAQPPSLDGLVYSNFAAGQAVACGPLPHVGVPGHLPVQGQHDAYLLDPSFGSAPLPVDYLTGAMRFGAGMGMGMGGGGDGGDLSSLLTAGGGGGIDLDGMFGAMPAMDSDTMTMWTTAPTNLELDDWNTYISNVEQLMQAQGQVHGQGHAV